MGAWQQTMEFQELSNTPDPGPKIINWIVRAEGKKTERICSRAVLKEMRDVLSRMTTSAAKRGLTSADSMKKRTWKKTVSVAAELREGTASRTRKSKLLSRDWKNLNVQKFRSNRGTPGRVKRVPKTCGKRREAERERNRMDRSFLPVHSPCHFPVERSGQGLIAAWEWDI